MPGPRVLVVRPDNPEAGLEEDSEFDLPPTAFLYAGVGSLVLMVGLVGVAVWAVSSCSVSHFCAAPEEAGMAVLGLLLLTFTVAFLVNWGRVRPRSVDF